jgi:hypothetical protein
MEYEYFWVPGKFRGLKRQPVLESAGGAGIGRAGANGIPVEGAGAVTGTTTGGVTGAITGAVTGTTTGGVTGAITGGVTGATTGGVTGAITGAVTGATTGAVTGDATGGADPPGVTRTPFTIKTVQYIELEAVTFPQLCAALPAQGRLHVDEGWTMRLGEKVSQREVAGEAS